MGFARAMNEFARVNLRTTEKLRLADFVSKDAAMLYRGLKKSQADFGVVISGQPVCPAQSARWIVWETTELPEAQKRLCGEVAFLWAPSAWGKRMLIANGISPGRVEVVPEGVDTEFFKPCTSKKESAKFRFLMVGKWETRKFCDELVRAFCSEFKATENVELFLQAHNPYIAGFSLAEKMKNLGVSNEGQIVLGSKCTQTELRELYRSAECFVLPTRSEGWGLPILESMACGVPAIVTRYSAPLDYMTEENGYLLNVARWVDAHDPVFDINTGQWTEPDVNHLRFLMRHAFQNRAEVREKGLIASRDANKFTWKRSAEIALTVINRHLVL